MDMGGYDSFEGSVFPLLLLCIVLPILGIFIVQGISFSKKFETIRCGMDYAQVISIIGGPDRSDTTGDIATCIWKVPVLRGITITRVIVFKDDKVFSITKG